MLKKTTTINIKVTVKSIKNQLSIQKSNVHRKLVLIVLSSDNLGVTGYRICYGSNIIDTASAATTYRITGLTPGTSYSFTVSAYDINTSSQYSDPVTVTTTT